MKLRVSEYFPQNPLVVGLLGSLSSVPLALVFSAQVADLLAFLSGGPIYEELKSGNLAVYGGSKSGDTPFVFLFWALVGLFGVAGYRFSSFISRHSFGRVLLYAQSAISVAFLFGSMFSRVGSLGEELNPAILVSLSQVSALIGFSFHCWITGGPRSGEQEEPWQDWQNHLAWFALYSSAWIPVSGGIILLRWLGSRGPVDPTGVVLGLSALTLVTVLGIASARLLLSATPFSRMLPAVLAAAWGIGGLPHLLPPMPNNPSGLSLIPGIKSETWIAFLLALGGLIVLETTIRCVKSIGASGVGAGTSSLGVVSILVGLRAGGGIPEISNDDYHFGEIFTPGYLFFESGLEGVGTMARGMLANLAPGILNTYFFSGQASTLTYSLPIIAIASTFLAHIILRPLIGLLPATAVAFSLGFANHYIEGDLVALTLGFAALALLNPRYRPIRSGPVQGVLLTTAILVYPLMGVAITLIYLAVSLVLASSQAMGRQWSGLAKSSLKVLVSVAVGLGVAAFDSSGQLVRSVDYVVTQASSNEIAHGVPLSVTLAQPFGIGLILTVSFASALIASAFLIVTFWKWGKGLELARGYEIGLALVPLIFVLGMSGRFLGRVDPGMLSDRPLAGSLVTLGLVIPVAAFLIRSGRSRLVGSASIAAATLISVVYAPIIPTGVTRTISAEQFRPAVWNSQDYVIEIPALGLGNGDSAHLESIRKIKEVSAAFAGLQIENLSQRNALNAYLGWPNAGLYLAPYNIPNAAAETEEIHAIQEEDPEVLFIGPGTWHDSLSMTLRVPLLAEWVVQNYLPMRCDESHWAVREDIAQALDAGILPGHCERARTESEAAALWAVLIGAPVGIGELPHAWAKNSIDMEPVGTLDFRDESADEGTTILSAEWANREVDVDYLRIAATCNGTPGPTVEDGRNYAHQRNHATLSWVDKGSEEELQQIQFSWGAGEFLVPVRAYPMWPDPPGENLSISISASENGCPTGWIIETTALRAT